MPDQGQWQTLASQYSAGLIGGVGTPGPTTQLESQWVTADALADRHIIDSGMWLDWNSTGNWWIHGTRRLRMMCFTL